MVASLTCPAVSIQLYGRLVFFDVVSDLGFASFATRPDGDIYSAFDEADDTRSARVAAEPECDPFTTIQVQSHVHIAIGPSRGVRLCFLRSA